MVFRLRLMVLRYIAKLWTAEVTEVLGLPGWTVDPGLKTMDYRLNAIDYELKNKNHSSFNTSAGFIRVARNA